MKVLHVMPYAGFWAVKYEDSNRRLTVKITKQKAHAAARKLAGINDTIVVHTKRKK